MNDSTPMNLERRFETTPPSLRDAYTAMLPTIPGIYIDNGGDLWGLSTDGHWHDKHGKTYDPKYNFALAQTGIKFTLVVTV